MPNSAFVNITTATTTEIASVPVNLQRVAINKDVASSVITIYDNTAVGVGAADPDGIATSQTPAGAGNLTLDGALTSGGVATIGYGRVVNITSVGNDTARTFTVTGTDENGNSQTEAITGANATVATGTKNFLTVTQIAVDAATAGAVTAGTPVQSGTVIATITAPATLLNSQVVMNYELGCQHALTVITDSAVDATVVYEA